jgi:hypothetical protein
MRTEKVFIKKKIKYDGPHSMAGIYNQIYKDAQEEGLPHINEQLVSSVIQYVYSVRGAFNRIPYFLFSSAKYFGRFTPNPRFVRLKQRLYVEFGKFKSKQGSLMTKALKYTRANNELYKEYLRTSKAVIPLEYRRWVIHTGRKETADKMFKDIYSLRIAFTQKIRTTYKEVSEPYYNRVKFYYKHLNANKKSLNFRDKPSSE